MMGFSSFLVNIELFLFFSLLQKMPGSHCVLCALHSQSSIPTEYVLDAVGTCVYMVPQEMVVALGPS